MKSEFPLYIVKIEDFSVIPTAYIHKIMFVLNYKKNLSLWCGVIWSPF